MIGGHVDRFQITIHVGWKVSQVSKCGALRRRAWYVPETPCGYVSMQLSERGNLKSSGFCEIGPMLASFSEQVDRTNETVLRRRKETEKSVRSDFHRIIIAGIAEVTSKPGMHMPNKI